MQEQQLDLRGTWKAVRRRRWLVVFLVAFGLGAGVAYATKNAPAPAARALVLLPPNAFTSNPGTSPYTKTQEIIVSSARVLSDAVAAVYPPVTPENLSRDLSVSAPSQDVLQITVRGKTSHWAERMANAVAASYISYVDGIANGSGQLLAQLHREVSQLTEKILGLQKQIDAAQSRLAREKADSPDGQRDTALVSSLDTEQEQLSIQLNGVNSQVVNAELTAAQTTSATQLLQRAEPIGTSADRTPLIALLGALGGLVAGSVLAVGLARRDQRLRSREAIATAMGVPVVASMWAERCRKVSDWRQFLEPAKDPSPVETWNARRLFHRLIIMDGAPGVEVRLLAFSGDDAAAAAGVKIAAAAAMLGMRSRLEIVNHPAFASLRAACVVTQGPVSGGAIVDFAVAGTASGEFAGLSASVRLEAVDPGKPEVGLLPGTSLLLVSSGFATSAELARVALAASDTGNPVAGVVVTNPDADDYTSGLLPETSKPLQVIPHRLNGHATPELARREPS